jgi:ADP-ribosylglycohydrolase
MPSDSSNPLTGSLIGLALGDALGSVVEARPPAEAAAYVADYLRAGRAGVLGFGDYPFGQYSDDTQLARELLLSLAERREFDPADYAGRIAALVARDGLLRGGPGTTGAAWRYLSGIPWGQAAEPAPYAGNGAAMRAGPLGALWPDDLERVQQVSVAQARVTHHDPRATAGAVAIAGAVAFASRPGPIESSVFLARLLELVLPVEASVAEAIGGIETWITMEPAEALEGMARSGLEPDSRDGWHGFSSFVTGTVCWSLYAFLRTPDDYWETMCTAIEAGGDTDTVAAMAGSIAGARVGLAGLPRDLAGRLNDRGAWDYPALEQLAVRCAERLQTPGS